MRKITALLIAVIMLCSTVFASNFTDVPADHWALTDIEKAFEAGFITGDGDGTFRPDDSISRGEFLKIAATILASKMGGEIPDEWGDTTHWASKYNMFARALMFQPLKDEDKVGDVVPGLFNEAADYEKPISRWEMAFMLSEAIIKHFNVLGGEVYTPIEGVDDVYPEAVANSVKSCKGFGIIQGDENGNLNIGDGATRAEATAVLNRFDSKLDELISYFTELQKQQEEQKAEQEAYYKSMLKTYEEIPAGHPIVTVEMENGEKFKIELYPEYAPQTVANFVSLVKDGFYDGLTFHRVIADFMAQGGDPVGDGTGDASHVITGEFSQNNFTQNIIKHERGTISMARSSHPDSASCQFFICYESVPSLDGQYAAFGKVIEGMEVVDAFLNTEMLENNIGEIASPSKPIVMKKLTVSAGTSAADGDVVVYVAKNGTEYHSQRCKYLRGDVTALSLSEAEAQGFTACKRCDVK